MKPGPDELLLRARQANDDLAGWLRDPSEESVSADWLLSHADELAATLYAEQAHWHRVSGECVGDVPFEIRMQAVALLSCAWVTDIFLRKARDRTSPAMRARWDEWRNLLFDTLDRIALEVESSRDRRAEEEYEKAKRSTSNVRHLLNKLRWGH